MQSISEATIWRPLVREMNLDIVKEEPNEGEISTNTITQGSNGAVSLEMSFDIAKAELKSEGQYELTLDGEAYECEETLSLHSSAKERPKEREFSANAKAQDNEDEEIESMMRPPSIEYDRIIWLMALLQDFEIVATAGMSWLWPDLRSILPSVSCPDCGIRFRGTNRMLSLVKHIHSNHLSAALQLTILVMDNYGVLIRCMKRALKCEIEMLVQRHL